MYLKQIYVQHNGPIDQAHINLSFSADGTPKPCVIVGANGSGKTHLLSIIADALFEAAASHYQDVVPQNNGLHRPWFRVSGGITTTMGASGGCTLLEFQKNEAIHVYTEKSGTLPVKDVAQNLPEKLRPHANWADEGNVKQIGIEGTEVEKIFRDGAYVYFPSSRAEKPHWLNQDSLIREEFDLEIRYNNQLRKPIYVESGLDKLKQWLLCLVLDVRMDVFPFTNDEGKPMVLPVGDPAKSLHSRPIWEYINQVLQAIFGDQAVRLGWAGRHSLGRIVVHRGGTALFHSLDGLSAGQATLLNIFGTLLRYGDRPTQTVADPRSIEGICVIDEIDAHMHVDLQHRALPLLIKMFPKIQFIVSSHSPFFVLGMEKAFGQDGMSVIDMPSGTPIQAEAYAEFGRALDALQETKAFNEAIAAVTGVPGKLLVLLEGETDPKYMTAAAKLLGREALLEKVEFEWVGAKDPKTGQGFHTGKDALNSTLTVLRAKPELVRRPILLLYDNDTNKAAEDIGHIHVRSMPTNNDNTMVEAGIENLLPQAAITPEMFDRKAIKKKNGSSTVTTTLNKMKLCIQVCETVPDPAYFQNFSPVLDIIDALVVPVLEPLA